MQSFDVFVIGGGPAGKTLAQKCKAGGLSVGIAEPNGFGGTCTLRGCDPKRVMVTRTMAMQDVRNLQGAGLDAVPTLDWPTTRAVTEDIIREASRGAEQSLADDGIEIFEATAKFIGRHRLQVGDRQIEAEHIVIATGQRPAPLEIPGAAFAKTSDEFHRLGAIPESVAFVGGGYIGMESAHFLARAGSKVTILNNDDDPLPMFEDDLVQRFLECTPHLGITYVPNTNVEQIEELSPECFRVSAKDKDGTTCTYDVALVMNTAGRVPNLDALDLDEAGIETEKGGIPVDDYFRVRGAAKVYAIGDIAVNEAPPLTPVAGLEAEALAKTVLGTDTKPDYRGIATVVYGLPELATVGMLEEDAKEKGLDYTAVAKTDADGMYNAKRSGARAYGYKVIIDKRTDEILGAHLIGPQAGEQINVLALAIRAGLTAETLRAMPFAYPTWGSDVSGMMRE